MNQELNTCLEWLNAESVMAAMTPPRRAQLKQLEILSEIDSTNRYLLEQETIDGFRACFAEYQSAGRGRAGRQWISPTAAGIWLSVQGDYETLPPALNQRLALAVAEQVHAWGASEIGIKWPNDVVWRGTYKLAGILTESRFQYGKFCVVCGVGLNLQLPSMMPPVSQPWTDLQHITGRRMPRNQCAGALLDAVLAVLIDGQQTDPKLVTRWRQWDVLYHTQITLNRERGDLRKGMACGIDVDGALLLASDGIVQRYVDGEVRVQRNV